MGSRKNNIKTVIKKKKSFAEEEQRTKKLRNKSDVPRIPLLKRKEAVEVIDPILQGLKLSSRGLNLGEIKREHKVELFLLFDELRKDPRNQNLIRRTEKSEIDIADVLVDYIKIKNKPIEQILKNMSYKEIEAINKLIFKKMFLD